MAEQKCPKCGADWGERYCYYCGPMTDHPGEIEGLSQGAEEAIVELQNINGQLSERQCELEAERDAAIKELGIWSRKAGHAEAERDALREVVYEYHGEHNARASEQRGTWCVCSICRLADAALPGPAALKGKGK